MVSENRIEIFLHPGDLYLGGRDTVIRTILGSCIAITIWHGQSRQGGMCHFLLPSRPLHQKKTIHALDGRYADEALTLLFREASAAGMRLRECEFKYFGGGNMMAHSSQVNNIGQANINACLQLLSAYAVTPISSSVGGAGHRNVIFDIANGDVWVHRREANKEVMACQ